MQILEIKWNFIYFFNSCHLTLLQKTVSISAETVEQDFVCIQLLVILFSGQ